MPNKQQGATLLVALILLLALTLAGVSGMSSVGLQERMAGSLGERAAYFEAAEAGMRHAERYLSSAVVPTFDNTAGKYHFNRTQCRFDQASNATSFYDSCSSVRFSDSSFTRRAGESGESIDVRYLIEHLEGAGVTRDKGLELSDLEELALYRITVMAAPRDGDAAVADPLVILQSTYLR